MENKYLLHGKLNAKTGQQEALAEILIDASKLIANAKGCRLYVVGLDPTDSESVWVTEIWDSKEDHDLSLHVEGVKDLIMKAMPIIEGQPAKGQEIDLLGGFGI